MDQSQGTALEPNRITVPAELSDPKIPIYLFHTTLTVIDYANSSEDGGKSVYPLGTHADLNTATVFASLALQRLGYDRANFEAYEDYSGMTHHDANGCAAAWSDDNSIVVHARRPSKHDFLVGISTTLNNEHLPTKKDNPFELQLPQGSDQLYYLLQTTVDYNVDRSGAVQGVEIEGVYVYYADAIEAAKGCLIGVKIKREDFIEYDERDSEEFKDEWPFGEDVVVHAVTQTGQNFKVALMTTLRAHVVCGNKI